MIESAMNTDDEVLPLETITHRIVMLRGQKVLLDEDLAALYGVPTGRFNEQVKRNLRRFPVDFMFQVTDEEFVALRSHFAISNKRGGRRYMPYAFTEHGAIMAAMILNSPRATEISVYVVRAFIQLRQLLASHQELAKRLEELENKTEILSVQQETFAQNTRAQLKQVFEAIRELRAVPEEASTKRPIGFVVPEEKSGKTKEGG